MITLYRAKRTRGISTTYITKYFRGRKEYSVIIRLMFDLVEIRQSEMIKI